MSRLINTPTDARLEEPTHTCILASFLLFKKSYYKRGFLHPQPMRRHEGYAEVRTRRVHVT